MTPRTPSFGNLFIFKSARMSKTTNILVSLTANNAVKFTMYLINISLTILLINRWLISGHFPLSNLYESLIFLSWSFSTIYSITSFTLRGEAKTTLIPIIGWSVAPITLLTCSYAFFCVPQQLQKAESLVPALQSNWLIMHVSVMILSYASLILGSLFACSLLFTYGLSPIVAVSSKRIKIPPQAQLESNPALYAEQPQAYEQNDIENVVLKTSLVPTVSNLINQLVVALRPSVGQVASITNFATSFATYLSVARSGSSRPEVNLLPPVAKLVDSTWTYGRSSSPLPLPQAQKFVGNATRDRNEAAQVIDKENSIRFVQNIKDFKNKVKQSATKNNSFLDNLSYRFIGLGFALLTLGIISGAVWANSAWGSYWSWDPKETWAFITWLTYAIYLHLRISKGWYGKHSAFVAVFGFFIVWFCYLGVNLFGKGLHSYAFV